MNPYPHRVWRSGKRKENEKDKTNKGDNRRQPVVYLSKLGYDLQMDTQ